MAKHGHQRQWGHPSVNSYTGIQAGACTRTHAPSLTSFHSVSHYPPLPCGQLSHSQTQQPSSPSACVKVSAHSESLRTTDLRVSQQGHPSTSAPSSAHSPCWIIATYTLTSQKAPHDQGTHTHAPQLDGLPSYSLAKNLKPDLRINKSRSQASRKSAPAVRFC